MSQRPNVIIFFTDQQRWDTTGVHGNPLDLTPNFDRMAQYGTHASHAFTASTCVWSLSCGDANRDVCHCQRLVPQYDSP